MPAHGGSPMLVPEFEEALGFALMGEDLRGDFAQAADAAELSLQRAASASDLAEALLVRGIVHLLQGGVAAATSCFARSVDLVPDDHAHQLLALGYSMLAARIGF